MLRAFLGLVVALLLAGVTPAVVRADAVEPLPSSADVVWDFGSDRGVTWFQFGRHRVYQIPQASRAVKAALKASQQRHISLHATYDPNSGRVDSQGRVTFIVRRLTFDGRTFEVAPEQPQSEPVDARDRLGRDVARSVALRDLGRLDEARAAVGAVLASGTLEPRLYEAALRNQFAVVNELAHELAPERRAEADVLRMEGYRALDAIRILAPTDRGITSATGHMLGGLGAYEEALAIFRDMARADPGDAYWPTLNASIYQRLMGRPAEALASIDAFAAAAGAQTGMAFHYHRGWTLAELGRHDDAIEAFTLGLANQPDFPWALIKRACSYAAVGRLRQALADQERGVMLIEAAIPSSAGRRAAQFNLVRARAVQDQLRTAIEKDTGMTAPSLCGGYWPVDEERRTRSPLLPAREATPAAR